MWTWRNCSQHWADYDLLLTLSSWTFNFAPCKELLMIYILTETIGCICTLTWCAARPLQCSWHRSDISPARLNPCGRVQYYLRSGSRSDLNYSIYDCCPVSRASVWLAALMSRTRPEPLKSSLFCWLGILIIRRPAHIAFTSLSHTAKKKKNQQKRSGELMTLSNTIQWNKMNETKPNFQDFRLCMNKVEKNMLRSRFGELFHANSTNFAIMEPIEIRVEAVKG